MGGAKWLVLMGLKPRGPQELKAHSSRVDDLRDWECPHEPGSQLLTVTLYREMLRGQPVLLTHLIMRYCDVVAVGGLLIPVKGVQCPRGQ